MKKTVIITGKTASGKTTLSDLISEGRNSAFINPPELCGQYPFANVKKDTEFIVLDEVSPGKAKTLSRIKHLILSETILVNKKMKAPFEIERPHLIISGVGLSMKDFPETDNTIFIKLSK